MPMLRSGLRASTGLLVSGMPFHPKPHLSAPRPWKKSSPASSIMARGRSPHHTNVGQKMRRLHSRYSNVIVSTKRFRRTRFVPLHFCDVRAEHRIADAGSRVDVRAGLADEPILPLIPVPNL